MKENPVNIPRYSSATLCAIVALGLVACAVVASGPDPAVRAALAPTGALRVAVYSGSPTSLVRNPATGETKGVALDLGKAMAERLGVPMTLTEFANNAVALESVKNGEADFAFTNATPARMKDMDFSPPVLAVEQGFLAAPNSTLQSASEVDRAGMRVGVSKGSSSERELGQVLKAATVVSAPTLKAAAQMLADGKLDAFGTNKAILHELSDDVPGSRVLPGRYGLENFAIGIPKGRSQGLPWLRQFVAKAQADGIVAQAVQRAGLRGTMAPESK
jgi:polar amino acid transport system substrate-binding protein